jgi:hypothetical protein
MLTIVCTMPYMSTMPATRRYGYRDDLIFSSSVLAQSSFDSGSSSIGVWEVFVLCSTDGRFFYDGVYHAMLVYVVVEALVC